MRDTPAPVRDQSKRNSQPIRCGQSKASDFSLAVHADLNIESGGLVTAFKAIAPCVTAISAPTRPQAAAISSHDFGHIFYRKIIGEIEHRSSSGTAKKTGGKEYGQQD